eukprot:gene20986-23039_t
MAADQDDSEVSYTWTEEKFKDALTLLYKYFNDVDMIKPDQEKALRSYFKAKKNVYYSAPTGHGKSLVFQAMPLVADMLAENVIGTSNILVITPLLSLMHDQVDFLNSKTGLSAAAIYQGQTEEVLEDIADGVYSIVYASPESMLSSQRWRKIIAGSRFADCCVGIVFDEAHCICQWGIGNASKQPFRKWYGLVSEIISLLPKKIQVSVFTATATQVMKQTLMDMLKLEMQDTLVVEKSPVKNNLKFSVVYIGNDKTLQQTFSSLINEVKEHGVNTKKTLVFCQTRNQAALIWNMFRINLGADFFKDKTYLPTQRLIEMYHAGTPQRVKDFILEQMQSPESHVRVLICTIAFGMGVNCKNVLRTIHFGPSKTLVNFIQECGRAGRSGDDSYCFLLYNGFLLAKSDEDIKEYAYSKSCRRSVISSKFPIQNSNEESLAGCCCCDNCANTCDCSDLNACLRDNFQFVMNADDHLLESSKIRIVTKEHRKLLKIKLKDHMKSIHDDFHSAAKSVSFPNCLMQFCEFHIEQVLQSCEKIFSLHDILQNVEIWNASDAHKILKFIQEIFGDLDSDILDEMDTPENCFEAHEADLHEDWLNLRDDSEISQGNFESLMTCGSSAVTADTMISHSEIMWENFNIDQFLDISGVTVQQDNINMDID